MAARWVDENIDIGDISGKLFEKFGVAASPARLLAMTPFELIALFTRRRGDDEQMDRVAEFHRINHVARAGLRPIVPSWLMKEGPRRAR